MEKPVYFRALSNTYVLYEGINGRWKYKESGYLQ